MAISIAHYSVTFSNEYAQVCVLNALVSGLGYALGRVALWRRPALQVYIKLSSLPKYFISIEKAEHILFSLRSMYSFKLNDKYPA